jgi:hypothetical protein
MLQDAYPKMKFVDPYCQVIVGGLSPAPNDPPNYIDPSTYLTSMYSAGAKNYFDAVGIHPYTQPSIPGAGEDWNTWTKMVNMRATMVAQNDSAKRMWITESGAPTNGDLPTDYVTEAKHAELGGSGFVVWS